MTIQPLNPPTERPALMTARELAQNLCVDTRTLRRWRAAGLVPEPIQFGRSVRWRRSEIEKWIS
jgi:predicted DNA-binding transcriptional regulator AlpA